MNNTAWKREIFVIYIPILCVIIGSYISICLNVPVFRQILGFICYSIISGYLITKSLRIETHNITYTIVLSVGLSLSFLTLTGMMINTLLPEIGVLNPLSSISLVTTFTLILAILWIIAVINVKSSNSGQIRWTGCASNALALSLMFFPIVFPCLAITGTQLMNTTQNNSVLIVLYILIPLFIAVITLWHHRFPSAAFPIAISSISVSLLLARSLTSNYLLGSDVFSEFRAFLNTLDLQHWVPAASSVNVGNSLGVSFLPVVYEQLLNVEPLFVFKFVCIVLMSLFPTISYVIYRRYFSEIESFYAALFLVVQYPFLYLLTEHIRVGIALIYFSIIILLIFDRNLNQQGKGLLLVIFTGTLTLSYYVTPFFIAVVLVVLSFFEKLSPFTRGKKIISIYLTVLALLLIAFWWGMISTTFNSYVEVTSNIFSHLADLFELESRGTGVRSISGYKLDNIAFQFTTIINDISFLLIFLGVLFTLSFEKYRRVFDKHYIVVMLLFLLLLCSVVVIPYMSHWYDAERYFLHASVILAPALIIGCIHLVRRCPGKYLRVIGCLLILLFLCNSYFIHHLAGTPNSEIFDLDHHRRDLMYTYDSEVTATRWVGIHNSECLPVYVGSVTRFSIFDYTDYGRDKLFKIESFGQILPESVETYMIFLRHVNIHKGVVYSIDGGRGLKTSLTEFTPQINKRSKIYASDYSEVYV